MSFTDNTQALLDPVAAGGGGGGGLSSFNGRTDPDVVPEASDYAGLLVAPEVGASVAFPLLVGMALSGVATVRAQWIGQYTCRVWFKQGMTFSAVAKQLAFELTIPAPSFGWQPFAFSAWSMGTLFRVLDTHALLGTIAIPFAPPLTSIRFDVIVPSAANAVVGVGGIQFFTDFTIG